MDWGILGHQWAVRLFKEHIQKNMVRHAYLISGPRGVGRRTLAIRLAQAFNCLQPIEPGEPCLTCHACKRIEEMRHPDLSLIQAEEIGGVLKVDQIRSLQHQLALTPYESQYRVALILRFEEAHISASNALLKTLEEPNPQVIILMTASSPEILLPTVVSRCELIRLRPLPVEELTTSLQSHLKLPADRAQLISHIANGRPGYAIDLQNNPDLLANRSQYLQDLLHLLTASNQERFSYADELAKNKELTPILLTTWLSFWRDILLLRSQSISPITNLNFYSQVESLAREFDVNSIYRNIFAIDQSLNFISQNVNLRLVLEVLLLDLPKITQEIVLT